jgi:hypothetical protein
VGVHWSGANGARRPALGRRRPDFLAVMIADFLELQRRMLRISFEQEKLFIGAGAD